MSPHRCLAVLAVLGTTFVGGLAAQVAISTKAGMIHVADGEVFLADKQVEIAPAQFPSMKENEVLRTGEGRAEVLLGPATMLRMGEQTSFKLLNNRVSDTRLLLEKGAILVEVMEVLDGNYLTVAAGDLVVTINEQGLYRIEAGPEKVRVYDGEARVTGNGNAVIVKRGRELVQQGTEWATAKFDENDVDALYRWARRRSEYMAKANISAARSAGTGMFSGSPMGRWYFNPWMGMMTWLPYNDTLRSPFGWRYYTPWTVMPIYQPQPVYAGGGGGSFGGGYGSGYERSYGGSYSGGFAGSGMPVRTSPSASAGSVAPSSAPAASAPAAPARGGDAGAGGGRGGAGGGGRQ